jgi:hypothetical protein
MLIYSEFNDDFKSYINLGGLRKDKKTMPNITSLHYINIFKK